MALPKLTEVPWYNIQVPSNQKEVKFRPFLVKEEKILLMALESEDPGQISNSVLNIIKSCVKGDDLNHLLLTSTDIEYLFLKIRSKSVGEVIKLNLKCQKCESENEVSVNIDDIKIESKTLPKEIQLTDSIRIEVRQPSFHQLSQNKEMMNANTQTEQIFSLIKEVVTAVLTEEERISTRDVTKEEFQEFIDSMTQDQFAKIREYIESIPKMKHNVSFSCTNCASSNELALEGLQSFL